MELNDIGAALVAASEAERGSARNILRELFPYIDEASRRMSSRNISQWLNKNYGVQISPASILRALRMPDKHYQDFAEFIECSALIVENATDCPTEAFLYDRRIFEHVIQNPTVQAVDQDDVMVELAELRQAADFLREKWFKLSPRSQANCRRFFGAAEEKPAPDNKENAD